MASRPSEPVLAWLRKRITDRGTTVAALAERVSTPRAALRKKLSGAEPLDLDTFMALSQALEVTPADLGMPATEAPSDLEAPPPPAPSPVDPWGNHAAQLVRIAFDLGCDVQFSLDTSRLADSGVPAHVLRAHQDRRLAVRLDAAWHGHMAPRFEEEALTLLLGFDALYTCRLPWAAFHDVTFWPAPWEGAPAQPAPAPQAVPEPVETEEQAREPAGAPRERPRLRLVQTDED